MLFNSIDIYCERTGPELWSEPVNAVTNLLFIVAAWMAWRYAKHLDVHNSGVSLLIVLLAAIGIGSGLFHTFATGWAVILDVVPILLFELLFIGLYYRRIAGLPSAAVLGIVFLFVGLTMYAGQFGPVLNGSIAYVPSFVFLLATGMYHYLIGKKARYLLLAASFLFFLSLTFRTVDAAVCNAFPVGTHFLWHALNAAVLYLLMRGLLSNLNSSVRYNA